MYFGTMFCYMTIIYEEDGLILYLVQVSEHKVKGKSITVKKADVKPGKVTAHQSPQIILFLTVDFQIYVGKLPETGCEEEDIKEHFAQVPSLDLVIVHQIFSFF